MATQTKIRIREALEPGGIISLNQLAAKLHKYGVSKSNLSRWASQGKFPVVKEPAYAGDNRLFDEKAARRYIEQNYTPRKDNQARRARGKTIPQMQAERAASAPAAPIHPPQGKDSAGLAGVPSPEARTGGVTQRAAGPASSAPAPARQQTDVVLLNTREWVDRYYAEQARSMDGELRHETKDSYDWVFGRFAQRFTSVPMDPRRDRKTVLDYIHNLTNLVKGGPLSGGAKMLVHRQLSAFYNWLSREYGYVTPNLTHHGITSRRENAVAIRPEEIREVLSVARNHSEYTLVLLLAQTAARIGELCTMRPECLHDHWVEVWGKPTRANPTGYRQVPIPDEAYDHLRREFKVYGELVWIDSHGVRKALAGPLQPANTRRAINMQDSDTYRVEPKPTGVKSLQAMLRRLMKDAGVYEEGKLAHSFRRAYQAEFVKNGGAREFYRLIMGHFEKNNMDDLYTHTDIATIVEQARKYAPRSFLGEKASQPELALGVSGRDVADEYDEDDDDE